MASTPRLNTKIVREKLINRALSDVVFLEEFNTVTRAYSDNYIDKTEFMYLIHVVCIYYGLPDDVISDLTDMVVTDSDKNRTNESSIFSPIIAIDQDKMMAHYPGGQSDMLSFALFKEDFLKPNPDYILIRARKDVLKTSLKTFIEDFWKPEKIEHSMHIQPTSKANTIVFKEYFYEKLRPVEIKNKMNEDLGYEIDDNNVRTAISEFKKRRFKSKSYIVIAQKIGNALDSPIEEYMRI